MSGVLRVAHRYTGLICAIIWLLQAGSGLLLVFQWELDDALVRGPAAALDPPALSRALETYPAAYPGRTVKGVYASGGLPGRFDVQLARPDGRTDILRIDGRGVVLRALPRDHDWLHIGLFQFADDLHQTLFAGVWGRTLLALSGLVLISNIVVGLKLAWPRPGKWRQALWPSPGRTPAMTLFGLHRAIGLWLALPALVFIPMGIAMETAAPLQALIGHPAPTPKVAMAQAIPKRATPVTTAEAIQTAQRLYPGDPIAVVLPPTAKEPWYFVQLLQPGEWRRFHGQTSVFVSSRDGRVLVNDDVLKEPWVRKAFNAIYPIHTGEAGGLLMRCLTALVGIWLLGMVGLGVSLWATRRAGTRRL